MKSVYRLTGRMFAIQDCYLKFRRTGDITDLERIETFLNELAIERALGRPPVHDPALVEQVAAYVADCEGT